MLVLQRRNQQGVWIGDIHVIVTETRGNRCSIGIEAPPDVAIERDEVRERRLEAGAAAMTPRGTT